LADSTRMRSRHPYTVPAVARHSMGLALAVPEVVAQRVMRMWLAGTPLSQRDRDEFHRMYAEKFAAFYESWNAMALEMFRVSLTLGLFPVWTLTARKGEMPGGTLKMKLTGDVRLRGQPAGWRTPLRFETQSLDFDIERHFAQTKLPVNFYSGSRRLSSRGLSADLKRGTLRLESSVHGRFPP